MEKWLVKRENGNVIVTILRNKEDNTYSYVNLTKGHICPCRFNSVEEALGDMDKKIEEGTILSYKKLEEDKELEYAYLILRTRLCEGDLRYLAEDIKNAILKVQRASIEESNYVCKENKE